VEYSADPDKESRFVEGEPFVAPLSDADRDLFISVLDNPPPATESLKRALAAARAQQQAT
jgi:uncharacterized protein (DUF1778 family)